MLHLLCTKSKSDGKVLTLPFGSHRGLYMWDVAVAKVAPPAAKAPAHSHSLRHGLKSGIHAAGAHSHVRTLPADDVAAILHRRLHLGLNLLKRLGGRTSDAPSHLASAAEVTCPHCVTANGHRLAHSSNQYHSSHAGRLVHADIAGPFKRSWLGGFQYAWCSRTTTLALNSCTSSRPSRMRRTASGDSSLRSTRWPTCARMPSCAWCPPSTPTTPVSSCPANSRSSWTTPWCRRRHVPRNVHQLNGVAERSILAVCSLARSYFTASSVSVTFWPFAFQMAFDVLNRATGPAGGGDEGPSSYELLTGEKPRVMNILPFGCRAYAVKPRAQYSKTTIDPRAWVGVNMGRSARSPGAYEVYIPGTGRIVTTSDFQESLFPCRPRGQQTDDSAPDPPSRAPPDVSQPPGVPPVAPAPVPDTDSDALSDADTVEDVGEALRASRRTGSKGWAKRAAAYSAAIGRALDEVTWAVRGLHDPLPRRVLVLFSGLYARPDGLTAFLRARGIEVDQHDCDVKHGGGDDANVLNDAFFTSLFKITQPYLLPRYAVHTPSPGTSPQSGQGATADHQ